MTALKVIDGKGRGRRGANISDNEVNAYRDLEPDICDLVRAAEIAFEMAMKEDAGGCTLFSVEQFKRLAEDLKAKFYRA
jgi:hypothetical protein